MQQLVMYGGRDVHIGKLVAVEILSFAGIVESEVGDRHDDVVNDAASSDQVDEPSQDLG